MEITEALAIVTTQTKLRERDALELIQAWPELSDDERLSLIKSYTDSNAEPEASSEDEALKVFAVVMQVVGIIMPAGTGVVSLVKAIKG